MKYASTVFLRLVIIGLALTAVLFGAFLAPNAIAEATRSYGIGYSIPSAVGLYAAAVPFLVALIMGWRLLNLIDMNKTFSMAAMRTLGAIKYAAVSMSILLAANLPLIYAVADDEDAPGLILIGAAIIGTPFVIGVFAALMRRLLKNAVDLKKENDLTV